MKPALVNTIQQQDFGLQQVQDHVPFNNSNLHFMNHRAYIFGAVCPATGKTEALVAPFVNRDIMTQHLRQISEATEADRYALVIRDGAPWHTNEIAESFHNLSLLKRPPYSPELNPIEQVWQWLRQHCLANRCFSNYDDIVEQCCSAWNTFIECTDRVKSMCSRSWAKVTNF